MGVPRHEPGNCPSCHTPTHACVEGEFRFCDECGYLEGEAYVFRYEPVYLSLRDWHCVAAMLWKQYRDRKISWEEYDHTITWEICLKSLKPLYIRGFL